LTPGRSLPDNGPVPARFIALWGKPTDPDAFEAHYRTVHLEIVRRWPKLESYRVTRITGSPLGGEPPYAVLFEATFASEEDLREALRSPEVAEAGRDAVELSRRFGATLVVLTGVDL